MNDDKRWQAKYCKIFNILAEKIASCSFKPFKNLLIRSFIKRYHIDLYECKYQNIEDYPNLSSFFVRALKEGVRPQPSDEAAVISPVDGLLYGCGKISEQLIVEVKQRKFSLEQLLSSQSDAQSYLGGDFALFYLAPSDYHRVHFPFGGQISSMRYIPGSFYSVNPESHSDIPNVLALNERVVISYHTVLGPMTLVLVGAALVGSIEVVWRGRVGQEEQRIKEWRYDHQGESGVPILRFKRGDELGRFNFGSSVILLLPPGDWHWQHRRESISEHPVKLKMGQVLVTT